ncbi:PREDICTED: two-component response regulator ARR17 [Erythranthe guttata]|uniref:two-component response regulator ARR17 n=1 Tax=Erythranthe guttata TaxID=4155 RepID=UPI00064DA20F|nr:PREDICTED: two-component response regulator ARR17 [Erythranthe guttata]|eukprot:XP_012858135.1 PREDICTED: two-component response regulator ARR17 [Erythranthe guttata]
MAGFELLFHRAKGQSTPDGGVNALEYLGLADDDQSLGEYNTPKMKMICIDYEMPRMNGYELLKKLKESPLMEDVPVAVMASDNDPTLVKKCIEAGAVMFISKPVKEVDVEKLKNLMK